MIKAPARLFLLFLLSLTGVKRPCSGQELPLNIGRPDSNPHNFIVQPYQSPMERMRVRILIGKGKALMWSDPDSATYWLQQAIEHSKALGYAHGIAEAEINLGLTEIGKGNFNEGFDHYLIAAYYLPYSSNHQQLLTGLWVNIGATYAFQGNYEDAARAYYMVLQYMAKYRPKDVNFVMVYNNIADVLGRMGQYEQALYYLQEGEKLAVERNDRYVLAYLYTNMGELQALQKHYTKARDYLGKAMAYAKETRNDDIRQAVLSTQGRMMLEMNQPAEAITYLQEALAVGTTTFAYYSSIIPYYHLGEAYYRTGQYERAEKALLTGLNKAGKTGIQNDKLNALSTLATIYHITGQKDKELETKTDYIQLQSTLLNKEKVTAINQLEVKYRTAQKDKALAEKQLLIVHHKRENDKNKVLIGVSFMGIIGLIFLSIFISRSNRRRQRIVQLNAMIAGGEKERTRIAQELHDGIGGMLAVIQMYCSVDRNRDNPDLKHIQGMLEATSDEVRKTAHNLMPEMIQRFSLEEVLLMYCQNMKDAHKSLQIELQVLSTLPELSYATKLTVYRMIQEAIQNIIKHAHASLAVIQITRQNQKMHILIEDDGVGFNLNQVKKGLGLNNLYTRVNALQGTLSIESEKGTGTTINITFAPEK